MNHREKKSKALLNSEAPVPLPIFDELSSLKQICHITNQTQLLHYLPEKENLPLGAVTDFLNSCHFLYSYRGSAETFKSYRREVERLLQWCWLVQKKSLKKIQRSDIENFLEFCQNPPKSWIGLQHCPRFINEKGKRIANTNWRPFVATVSKSSHSNGEKPAKKKYALSQSALQAMFSILSSFFNYLIQEEYLGINPVAQIRQKSKFLRKHQNKKSIRRLSELQWAYVIDTVQKLAEENPSLHERTLFIMNALFGMYLRISELASSKRWSPQMSHFYKDLDGNWWFKTVGKGNKERDISVSDAMLGALKRYRKSLNLTPLPSPADTFPLLPKENGKEAIASTRHIRRIVQDCFDKSIASLTKDGFQEEADMLKTATVHWLRHTGISEDVKIRPREHVREDAGHSSGAITDKYIDDERRARHASAKKKRIVPPA